MIHFFPKRSSTGGGALARDLAASGAAHRVFPVSSHQKYRHRFQLALFGYPSLAAAALMAALRSLYARPRPQAVVVSSDVEAIVFAIVKALPGAASPATVLMPFIFTARGNRLLNRLRLAYYRWVMRRVACAICHSALEVERYRAMFEGCGTSFVFVPWGTTVSGLPQGVGQALPRRSERPVVVSAGKSGRDYPTLARANEPPICDIRIICNEIPALGGVVESATLRILTDCFDTDYLAALGAADIVVVPLRVDDISAGQMVIIQAMALRRPLIVTETPTVKEYLRDGETALLVPRGDAAALRGAILRLTGDPVLAAALGGQAFDAYTRDLSGRAHIRNVVDAVQRHLAKPSFECPP